MDSLRVRLMLLAALALLPLAGLALYNAVEQRHEAAAQAEKDALRLARVCADNEERALDSAEGLLALMADMSAVRQLDARACWPMLERVMGHKAGYVNLGLLNASGEVVTSAKPLPAGWTPARRGFFKKAEDTDQFTVSDFELGEGHARAEMYCGEPVLGENGEVAGVLFAELDLSWMPELNARLALQDGVSISVLRQDGVILMRIPSAGPWIGQPAFEATMGQAILKGGAAGTAHLTGADNVRRLYAFAPLDRAHGLTDFVSTGIRDDVAFAAARSSERRQLATLGIFALAALVGAWFAADILVLRGVRRLLKATEDLAAGNLRARAGRVHGGLEFRELSRSFDTMAVSLDEQSKARDAAERELEHRVEERTAELAETNRRLQEQIAQRARIEEELRLSKDRLDLALKGTNDGIWDWNLETNCVYFSRRWKEMLGYDDSEITDAFNEWETRLHPEDRDRAFATIHEYFSGKRPTFELEHRLRHKDGTYRWILSRGVALREENGQADPHGRVAP